MKRVVFNKKFDNNAIVYGAPKTGKTTLAISIVRDIIETGKDVLWINNEMQSHILAANIYKGFISEENVGRAFIYTVPVEWLEKEDVVKHLNSIFEDKDINEKNIALVVIDMIIFTDHSKCTSSYEKLLNYFQKCNISILGVMQKSSNGGFTMPLRDAHFCYVIDPDGEIFYKNFKLTLIKDWPESEDLFISSSASGQEQ